VAFFCGCEEHSILNTNAIPFPLLLLLLSTLLLTGAPETEALSGFNLSEAKDVTRAAAMPEISPKPPAAAAKHYTIKFLNLALTKTNAALQKIQEKKNQQASIQATKSHQF
jgi:hypothetical protein